MGKPEVTITGRSAPAEASAAVPQGAEAVPSLDGFPLGVVVLSERDEVTAWNTAAADMLALRDEHIGLPLRRVFSRGEWPRVRTLTKSRQGAVGQSAILERALGEGESQFLELTRGAAVVVVQDVTTRIRGEQQLAGTNALLRGMVENTTDAVFVKDLQGRYVLINRAGSEIIGREPAGVLGKTAMDVFPEEAARAIMAHDAEVIAKGEPHRYEEVVPIDGEEHVFLSTKSPYFGFGGAVAGLVGIASDITHRKQEEERQRFLAEASALLDASLDVTKTLDSIAALSVPTVADVCVIDLLQEDGSISGVAVAASDRSVGVELQELRRRYPIDPAGPHPVARVLRDGDCQLFDHLESMYEEIAQSEDHLAFARQSRYASAVVAPLATRGRILGAISLVRREDSPRYTPAEVELARDLGQRAATALDNARRFTREHGVAEALQRSLLPQTLPLVEGLRFAVRYLPGGEGVDVGGDFYDVLVLDEDSVALAIGDVAGKGIRAATVMGQLRTAMRVCALETRDPAELLEKVNRAFQSIALGELATLLFMTLDVRTGALRHAAAAHPPPLIVHEDRSWEYLREGRSVPLASVPGATFSDAEAQLPHGATLVLYTDGLVERPHTDIDDRLDRLARIAAGGPADPGELADAVLEEMLRDAHSPDDVALVVARRPRR